MRGGGRHAILAALLVMLLAAAGLSNAGRADPIQDFADTGIDDALADLADRYAGETSEITTAALAILQDLAAKGNVRALSALGHFNLNNREDKKRQAEGIAQLEKAAAQHDAAAAAMLAIHFLYAEKTDQDFAKAHQFAQQAADLGLNDGFYALGLIEAGGLGMKQDAALAVRHMLKAADLGNIHAFHQLARYYHEGFGVEKNDVIAYTWATILVTQDTKSTAGIKLQDSLALLLLPDEIVEGQHLAASWKPGVDLGARIKADLVTTKSLSPDDVPVVSAPGPLIAADLPRVEIADIGIVERVFASDVTVQPDGTMVDTTHAEYEAYNEASLKDLGQIPIKFDNAIEQLEVVEAYTQKADGRKIPVDPSAILTQQAPDSQDNLMFDDQRRKVIIFPNVEVGDIVAFTRRLTRKPLIPGLTSIAMYFDPREQESDVRFSFTVPKSKPLFFETHGLKVEQSSKGDQLIYRVQYANRRPLNNFYSDFVSFDVAPRVFASSFRDYQQFVTAYRPLVEAGAVVTPQVQALADKLTAGITDRRAQAEALYNWVSRHIRYVGIEFGIGGVVPHAADKILTNGYGDCKDHSIVFATLLKAKGIKADLVLIDSGWQMTMSIPPRIQNFDHMITYLPEFDLYTDTTAEVAPFGTLPFSEYGKPVVHVPLEEDVADAAVVRRVPVLKPDAATLTMKTTAHLQKDGKVVGESETIGTGPYSIDLRQGAMDIQADNPAQKAAKWLKDDGYEGTGGFDFASPRDLTSSYRLAGHFETEAYDGLVRGSQFDMPRGLLDGWSPGKWLMGSTGFKGGKDDPTYCWSGHEVEELSLELPAGYHLAQLPTGSKVQNDHMSFRSTWSMTGQTVTVRREFSSTIDVPVCLDRTRTEMAAALRDIKSDYDARISLVAN